MKKIKFLLTLTIIGTCSLPLLCCHTSKQVLVHEPLKTPNYDFVPVETKEKTDVAIALVNPVFAREMKYSSIPLFKDFPAHMGTDYEEMITKRGYTLRGPFSTVDDMVYNDKAACMLSLQPEININLDFSQITRHAELHGQASMIISGVDRSYTTYKYSGTMVIEGRINMIFCEPFTREKIKVLSISIPAKTVTINDPHSYMFDDFLKVLTVSQEGAMMNPIISALEDIYQSSFKIAYNHLDPHEINDYAGDAKKVREKSNFNSK